MASVKQAFRNAANSEQPTAPVSESTRDWFKWSCEKRVFQKVGFQGLCGEQFPATMYQTYNGKATKTEIPFDITTDVLPGLLREPDRYWQHLATRTPQEVSGFESIVGDSDAIKAAVGRAQRAAIHDVPTT